MMMALRQGGRMKKVSKRYLKRWEKKDASIDVYMYNMYIYIYICIYIYNIYMCTYIYVYIYV